MKAENPAALRFILQDDIYLLNNDKITADKAGVTPVAEIIAEPVTPVLAAPVTKQPEPVVETPAVKLNYLGKHKKAFLILVHYTQHEFIADEHLTALENILKRKGFGIDDVAILNMATTAIKEHDQLIKYFTPTKLLIMGKDALPAQIEVLQLNQPKQLANLAALYSFSFDEMMSSTDNKKAFWDQMKNL